MSLTSFGGMAIQNSLPWEELFSKMSLVALLIEPGSFGPDWASKPREEIK
jgi:hypothetical protein